MECIAHIHESTRAIITACTEKFLLGSANPEENEFYDERDQVREIFAKGNYLSSQDILVAREFPIEQFKDRTDFPYIEKLLQAIYDLKDIDDFEFAYSLAEHAPFKR